jgi:hypothetical protein
MRMPDPRSISGWPYIEKTPLTQVMGLLAKTMAFSPASTAVILPNFKISDGVRPIEIVRNLEIIQCSGNLLPSQSFVPVNSRCDFLNQHSLRANSCECIVMLHSQTWE